MYKSLLQITILEKKKQKNIFLLELYRVFHVPFLFLYNKFDQDIENGKLFALLQNFNVICDLFKVFSNDIFGVL